MPSPSKARATAPYTLDALNYACDIHHVSSATVVVQPARERPWRGAAPDYDGAFRSPALSASARAC